MTLLLPAEYLPQRVRLRGVIDGLRNTSASDQAQGAAHNILEIELAQESKFVVVDGGPHVFSGFTKKLLPLDHNDPRWMAHLAMVYGLNAKDREITPKITSLLGSYALWSGLKMTPRRWTAYVDGALHLSQYNGQVMRLTGTGVTEDANGFLVDDGWARRGAQGGSPISYEIEDNGKHVLFADDDSGTVPADPIIGRNGKLFRMLQGVAWATETTSGLRPKHQVQALMIWMLAVAFPDAFPTKPILMIEGAPGSGKTVLMQMIQRALFGAVEPFTVSDDGLRDFWVALLRSPIMFLDNTDDMIKWLPDQICAYATGGFRTERKLHSNTNKVEIRPHSFIAVASKDPKSFRRGDTADRIIVLRTGTRRSGGESVSTLAARIERLRREIYGEWIYYVNRVVAAIRLEPQRRTTTRLGDFELFAYAACRALGWQSSVVVPELMNALNRERSAFAAETDIVIDVIVDWMGIPSNEGREVSARDLFKELAQWASTANKPFVKTPQALAQRLRDPHVSLVFDIYDAVKGDRKMYQIFKAVGTSDN